MILSKNADFDISARIVVRRNSQRRVQSLIESRRRAFQQAWDETLRSYNNNNNNNQICKAPECQKTSVALADRNSVPTIPESRKSGWKTPTAMKLCLVVYLHLRSVRKVEGGFMSFYQIWGRNKPSMGTYRTMLIHVAAFITSNNYAIFGRIRTRKMRVWQQGVN